jgi:serine/threonine-protein kinase RsbT
MIATAREEVELRTDTDVVRARQVVRSLSMAVGFGLVDLTKVVTAASELARNTLQHGRGGRMVIEELRDGSRRGVRLSFEDEGPGIADIPAALRDGYTTGDGLGLGLGGARRLMHDFHVESTPGSGTRVTVARWR